MTFQDGLITMLEKHAKKGRLVHAEGKLQTRRWSKPGEDGDRFSTEILVVPGHKVQFLDKPNRGQRQRRPGRGAAGDGARERRGHAGRWRARVDGRFRRRHPVLGTGPSILPPLRGVGAARRRLPTFFCSRLRVRPGPRARAARGARRGARLPRAPGFAGRASGPRYRPARRRSDPNRAADRALPLRGAALPSRACGYREGSTVRRLPALAPANRGRGQSGVQPRAPASAPREPASGHRAARHLQRRRVRRWVPFAIAHCERRSGFQGKDWARRFATGLSAAISGRCAPSNFRCNPSRLRSLRSLRAPLAKSSVAWRGELSSRRRPIVPHVLSAPTRCGVLRFAPAGTRRATALARLDPTARATVAQSLRSLRPHHSRTPPGHALRPRWLPCARVNQ